MVYGFRLYETDPLYSHLTEAVFPSLGIEMINPEIDSVCLNKNQTVYLYAERKSNTMLVGKFFGNRLVQHNFNPEETLDQEFNNIITIRDKGLNRHPYRVVKPLSRKKEINCLLVEEFIRGHDLDYYIAKAAYEGKHRRLMKKLKFLGSFIALFHKLTIGNETVGIEEVTNYFMSLVESLARDKIMDARIVQNFKFLCEEWKQDKRMWDDRAVMVHGDATPTNFIFHHKDGVTAIDLERMKLSDRVYDIGMLAAELKHHFAWRILNAGASEPFIEHLIRSYCEEFESPDSMFRAIRERSGFFVALGKLRIARNEWLNKGHREWLIEEAYRCLQH
jgi:thiamine kinase-like enzyme